MNYPPDLNQAGYLKMGTTPNISTPPREVIEWLIEHQEGWYGPKASWNKKQQDDFSKHAGFLMLFLNRFPLSNQAK
jgi:hypothetical protein